MLPRSGPVLLILGVLCGLTWFVYAAVAGYGRVDYDDPQVVGNPHVVGGLTAANVRWALTGYAVGHWEPLTWWSLQADRSAWAGRPGPMHVENVLLHAASAALLFGGLRAATGATGRSAVVAAVFAVHPMHVESVAWLTERRDALSTPPLIAAVWAYVVFVRSAGRARRAWYAATLALSAVSLSAKATGMTLPAVLLLVDVWPLRRTVDTRTVLEKVPFVLLAAPVAVLAVAAQRAGGAAASLGALSPFDRVANAIVTVPLYVGKLLVPTDLAVIYPHPGGRPLASVVAAAGLIALATVVVWRQRARRPYLTVGWAAFLVLLLPVSGVVQSGQQAMADRYAYLPSIGLSVALVWLVGDVVTRRIAAVLACGVVVALAIAARRQVGYWRDTPTLFAHAAAATGGDNWIAEGFLARDALLRGDWSTGADRYAHALRSHPESAKLQDGFGQALLRLGDVAGAERATARAVAAEPAVALFHVHHGDALSATPANRDAARAEYNRALSLAPADADALAGLAHLR